MGSEQEKIASASDLPQPPRGVEALALRTALRLEQQLTRWTEHPEEVDKVNRRIMAGALVAALAGFGVGACNLQRSRRLLSTQQRSPEAWAGPKQARLEYGQSVSGRQWILGNFAPGLVIRVLPSLFQEILADQLLRPNLPADHTVMIVIVGDSLVVEPSRSRVLKTVTDEISTPLLAQSISSLGNRKSGRLLTKVISILDRQRQVLLRGTNYYSLAFTNNNAKLSFDLSLAGIAALREVGLGNDTTDISSLEMSLEIRQLVVDKGKGQTQALPIIIESLDPAYLQVANSL